MEASYDSPRRDSRRCFRRTGGARPPTRCQSRSFGNRTSHISRSSNDRLSTETSGVTHPWNFVVVFAGLFFCSLNAPTIRISSSTRPYRSHNSVTTQFSVHLNSPAGARLAVTIAVRSAPNSCIISSHQHCFHSPFCTRFSTSARQTVLTEWLYLQDTQVLPVL